MYADEIKNLSDLRDQSRIVVWLQERLKDETHKLRGIQRACKESAGPAPETTQQGQDKTNAAHKE